MPFGGVVGVLVSLGLAAAWAGVFRRMGWSPWWGLVMIVPGLNVISFIVLSGVLSFQRWPIEQKVADLEEELDGLRGRLSRC